MAASSQSIDVPADGLCFYHCVGHALGDGISDFNKEKATALRARICRILSDMNFQQEAGRLMLEGSDGYPDELAFVAAARLLCGRLEMLSLEGVLRSYGSGAFRLRIAQTIVYDGAGHGSPHFQIAAMDYATANATEAPIDAIESELDAAYERLGADLCFKTISV